MRKAKLGFVIGIIAIIAIAVALPSSALADTAGSHLVRRDVVIQSGPSERGPCSAGGFSGWLRFWYIYDSHRKFVVYVGEIHYKITGGEAEEDEANVYWNDYAAGLGYSTASGEQDGLWHQLGGGYNRSRKGSVAGQFTFDNDWGNDPACLIPAWSM